MGSVGASEGDTSNGNGDGDAQHQPRSRPPQRHHSPHDKEERVQQKSGKRRAQGKEGKKKDEMEEGGRETKRQQERGRAIRRV